MQQMFLLQILLLAQHVASSWHFISTY